MPYEKFADGTRKDLSEEIPFELPHGWAWVRLMDLTDSRILNDGDWIVSSDMSENGNVKLLQLGSVGNGVYEDKGFKYITDAKFDELGCTEIHPGYLLINRMIGESMLTCILPQIEGKIITAVDVCWISPSPRYDVQFLLYLVLSPYFQKQAKTLGAGEGRVRISKGNLVRILFPFPPLAEQKRIVKKVEELFTYADKIGEASNGIATAAQLLDKKILDLAIRGQLVAQDPTDEPASELLKRIRETKKVGRSPRDRHAAESFIFRGSDRLAYETVGGKTRCIQDEIPFDIPESWKWCRLGDLIQIIAGVSYQKNDVTTKGVRILRGGNLKEDANIYLNDDDVFLPNSYSDVTTSVMCGDIIIVASTGSISVIGRPAIARDDMPGVQIGAFLRIVRTSLKEVKQWLHIVFLGEYYRKYIREKSKGTNIRNLKAEYLNELLVPIPPLAEQKRIVAKVEELKAQIKTLTM